MLKMLNCCMKKLIHFFFLIDINRMNLYLLRLVVQVRHMSDKRDTIKFSLIKRHSGE